jgi:hypothetical protein
LRRFLKQRGSQATADAFFQLDGPDGPGTAEFALAGEQAPLARIYLERMERGWLVVTYENCEGAF